MSLQKLSLELAKLIRGRVEVDVPLSKFTTWHVGGPADMLVWVESNADVQQVIRFAKTHRLPWQVIGNGSNLLVLDKGVRGIVVKLAGELAQVTLREREVLAGAGVLLPRLARDFLKYSFTGMEFAAGIPGSLGGAVIMNAGAYDSSLGDLVNWVEVVDDVGDLRLLTKPELQFSYRYSSLKGTKYLVTRVGLQGWPGDVEKSRALMASQMTRRKDTQPLSYPNAGSVFKNPEGQSAGRLIEQSGGKGLRVGDAMVSEQHANFIINSGNAKAADVLTLIEKIRALVQEKTGVVLELEVLVIGE